MKRNGPGMVSDLRISNAGVSFLRNCVTGVAVGGDIARAEAGAAALAGKGVPRLSGTLRTVRLAAGGRGRWLWRNWGEGDVQASPCAIF